MTGFMQDMRCAARNLWRAPGFAAAAVLTLAIGIGGTTAMFSLLDRAVLRPLPVSEPGRLVFLYWNGPWMNGSNTGWAKWSYPWYEDLRDRSEIFEELFCRYSTEVNFGYGGEARRVKLEMVSGNYFGALGLEASLGRAIARGDDRIPNGHPVAVLGHGFWREHFDSDPGAVGREIRLNGRVFEVIGVAPRGFRGVEFGNPAQVFVPIAMKAALSPGWMAMYDLGNRRNRWVNVMGRLKADVSLDEARAGIEPLFQSLVEYDLAQPELARLGEQGRGRYRQVRIEAYPAAQGLWQGRENAAAALTTLLAMVALLLLIGCANVANILMARGAARSKETAVRMALGAGRFRLAAQLMAESLLPALLAGLAALAVSTWLLAFLGWFLDESVFQHLVSTSPDLRLVFFTLAVSLLTSVLCGLTPALHSARAGVFAALKEQAGSVGGGLRLRKAFAAFQVFLFVVLIVGAGLFLRTLENLRSVDAGFDPEEMLVFGIEPVKSGYTPASANAFLQTLSRRLEALPEVEGSGYSMVRLLRGIYWNSSVTVEGAASDPGNSLNAYINAVSPGWFAALGIPLLEGRAFRGSDGADAPKVAVVNRKFAERVFGEESAVGRKLGYGGKPDIEIVGVVPDFPYRNVRDEISLQTFVPYTQMDGALDAHVLVRGAGSPQRLMTAARRIVRELDPEIPVFDMNTLADELDRSILAERMIATMGGAFGGMAVLLSGVGLYGMLALSMARRRREIGLRIALGCRPRDIALLALKELAALFALGALAAVPVSVALARSIESRLYGVSAFDLRSTLGALVLLLATAAAASFLPALRAARMQPMDALRSE